MFANLALGPGGWGGDGRERRPPQGGSWQASRARSSPTYTAGPKQPQNQELSAPAHRKLSGLYSRLHWVGHFISSKWPQQRLLSQGPVLENGSHCGNAGEHTFQGQGSGWGASHCAYPALGSTHGHVLSMTSSDTNKWTKNTCISFFTSVLFKIAGRWKESKRFKREYWYKWIRCGFHSYWPRSIFTLY